LTAAGPKAGRYVIEPVQGLEASLRRAFTGGNPKSSLGGPRTAREVAGRPLAGPILAAPSTTAFQKDEARRSLDSPGFAGIQRD